MGRHNGKARKAGEHVGGMLAAKNKKTAPTTQAAISAQFKHTTLEGAPGSRNMQSVLDRNDLDELMAMADLADRDFTAERGHAVVVSMGVVDPLAEARRQEERMEAEARNAHRLALPRRPPWTADMTPEQLDVQERTAFLSWRRNLAQLEEEERLVLTPFEKNLEVWRQLWRVLERSDIVVQVLDARDPLLYRSEDLERYSRELHSSKSSLLLLNKADLLPPNVRAAWADYFDKAGVEYAFWSAHAVIQEQQRLRSEAAALGVDPTALRKVLQQQQQEAAAAGGAAAVAAQAAADPRIRILDVDELLDLFERKCAAAVAVAGPDDPRVDEGPERRHMVGLVGYPNVGKSSTINALFGAKKTAVAPTPGKTKHFQTLHVSPGVVLCDCPGLVMPKFARSRAEMVAAGVVPIDRLTDIRQPVEVVAGRVGRAQLTAVYGIKLPPPPRHMSPDDPPTAEQVLRAYAVLRGWTAGSGLPDETRAGRQILRDYTNGKLVYCLMPPGSEPPGWVPGAPAAGALRPSPAAATATDVVSSDGGDDDDDDDDGDEDGGSPMLEASRSGAAVAAAGSATAPPDDLDAADLDLLQGLGLGPKQPKQKRPEYKFNKKAPRTKGDRGQLRAEGGYDGAGMVHGKKGGLVRVGGY
ncbi:hypothetical protein VOLCADRAFT_105489 [Volvox carteri f. nagariensis]|uniref:CP-type G domain-containing protein n=1 Tax=Volvox carteri f. nagariensis TaxID=3068 RepID=D8U156_VOLCA|nr:uncharacterized protein VOLCADRAFT_105489 [Volvox carteri f. nagariensis]EFJ46500.1 hypothetical protein VOLCADRAFT_105489 [Volvox carteri f. nagariensis]|eukprot:XP_002952357.1 hypothetical protein VOLCADRAFT_105489 [Volvox carteri f. nagariensis]